MSCVPQCGATFEGVLLHIRDAQTVSDHHDPPVLGTLLCPCLTISLTYNTVLLGYGVPAPEIRRIGPGKDAVEDKLTRLFANARRA